MSTFTLDEIRKVLKKADPNLEENTGTFRCAVVLLASASLGPDLHQLAAFTHYDLEWLREVEARLKKNGVWKNGKVHAAWGQEVYGMVEFWLDVCVAEGTMERARHNKAPTLWQRRQL